MVVFGLEVWTMKGFGKDEGRGGGRGEQGLKRGEMDGVAGGEAAVGY